MLAEFDKIIAALRTIEGLDVMETSEATDEPNHTLPAAVLDFERCPFVPITEDGTKFTINPSFSLILYVEKTEGDMKNTRERLKALIDNALRSMLTAFPTGFELSEPYMATLPYGSGEALAFACEILIGEEVYDLDAQS